MSRDDIQVRACGADSSGIRQLRGARYETSAVEQKERQD